MIVLPSFAVFGPLFAVVGLVVLLSLLGFSMKSPIVGAEGGRELLMCRMLHDGFLVLFLLLLEGLLRFLVLLGVFGVAFRMDRLLGLLGLLGRLGVFDLFVFLPLLLVACNLELATAVAAVASSMVTSVFLLLLFDLLAAVL